jgi:hypothetical protein
MRFLPSETLINNHRARCSFVCARDSVSDEIRGPLTEFSIVIQGALGALLEMVPRTHDDVGGNYPSTGRALSD